MKLGVKNNSKRLLLIGVLSFAIIGVSTGLALKMHPSASAASTQNASTHDGETNDTTKSTVTTVQDNGQDGETNDGVSQ